MWRRYALYRVPVLVLNETGWMLQVHHAALQPSVRRERWMRRGFLIQPSCKYIYIYIYKVAPLKWVKDGVPSVTSLNANGTRRRRFRRSAARAGWLLSAASFMLPNQRLIHGRRGDHLTRGAGSRHDPSLLADGQLTARSQIRRLLWNVDLRRPLCHKRESV